MSYWTKAATCGRRAILEEAHYARMDEIRRQEAEENEGDDALSVGTYYHALMEMDLRGQFDNEVWDQTDPALDGNFLEAVRLFKGYKTAWGSPLRRWGATLVGVELALGSDNHTGRADAILDIQDTATAYENTGLLLPSPGIYIVDWKTGKAKSDRDQWDFTFGNQSINYLMLVRKEYPQWDVKGMIFDKIIRHKILKKNAEFHKTGTLKGDKSYWAYLAQTTAEDAQVVTNLIQIGTRNVENNEANAAACFSGAKPCPMFTLGLCTRY